MRRDLERRILLALGHNLLLHVLFINVPVVDSILVADCILKSLDQIVSIRVLQMHLELAIGDGDLGKRYPSASLYALSSGVQNLRPW